MPTYTVMEAQEARRLPTKEGFSPTAVDHYTLKANGSDALVPVTFFRKVDQPIPSTGAVLEGEIGETDRFDKDRRKFTVARKGGWNAGPRKRDPAESRRIERQHSQHMALDYIRIKASLGALPEEPNGKQNFDFSDVAKLADQFDRDLDPAPPPSGLPDAGA